MGFSIFVAIAAICSGQSNRGERPRAQPSLEKVMVGRLAEARGDGRRGDTAASGTKRAFTAVGRPVRRPGLADGELVALNRSFQHN